MTPSTAGGDLLVATLEAMTPAVAQRSRMAQPTAVPPSYLARWALAVALILGVLGMHALMGPPTMGTEMGFGTGSTVVEHPASTVTALHVVAAAPRAEQVANPEDAVPPMDGRSPAGGHSMLTGCLAVLGSLAASALLAAALSSRATGIGWGTAARVVGVLSRRAPPPWTTPSLHQLSLLQV